MGWLDRFKRRTEGAQTESPPTRGALGDGMTGPTPAVPAAPALDVNDIQRQVPLVVMWLNTAPPRQARRYAQEHLELFRPETDAVLDALARQYAGQPDAVRRLRMHMALLAEIRARGSTADAIAEAYVNALGGLTLDVPPWLEELERQADEADPALRVILWRAAMDHLTRAGDSLSSSTVPTTESPDASPIHSSLDMPGADRSRDPCVADQSVGARLASPLALPASPQPAPQIAAAVASQLWEALYFAPGPDVAGAQDEGIGLLRSALAVFTRQRYPLQWAGIQSNMGTSVEERHNGERAANLEAAIACFNSALEVYTREATPLEWALTQNNLGNAYRTRIAGERADNLERAIACFSAALEAYARDAQPEQWANTQNNLGVVLVDRARGDHAENVEHAIACYTAALEVYTPESHSAAWAMTQNNRGIAYKNRVRGDLADNLERAIACYEAALTVRTREALPLDWAVTQNNLGRVLVDRIRGDRAEDLERAIGCYTAALEVRTREAFPFQWALTMRNLGEAYQERLHSEHTENVAQAMACYAGALEVYGRDTAPAEWAATQNALGNACVESAGAAGKPDSMERGIACYLAALEVYTPESFPLEWAGTRSNLGNAYRSRSRGDRAESIEMALACYSDALRVRTREALPVDWAATESNIGNAYFDRVRGERGENLEQAIACYAAALEVYTEEAMPLDWARVCIGLGAAYSERVRGDRAGNLEEALAHTEAALRVYNRDAYPADWASARHNVGKILVDRVRGDRAGNIERALACYADALAIYRRETYPIPWAMTQISLGNAYKHRVAGGRADNLERAIASYAAATEIYTAQAFPADWALAQNNLGNAYSDRVAGERAENLERAIACYEAALTVRTVDAYPLDWAATRLNVGSALADRIREDHAENLERAIACYTDALRVYTREALPLQWAAVQNNLGSAYTGRVLGAQAENLERSIACYEATLEVYSREALPLDWARMQNNLGNAYYGRLRGARAENLEHALAYASASLEVYARDAFPFDWALAQTNLGKAYLARVRGDRGANLDQAHAHLSAALEVYGESEAPIECARAQQQLGLVAMEQAETMPDRRQELLDRAIAHYRAALAVRTRDANPRDYRQTILLLAEAEATRGGWAAAQTAYSEARGAEALLLALSAGAHEQDAVLRSGRDAGTREAYALVRLGRLDEALLAVERGRARALAETRALAAADPGRIGDTSRREAYVAARQRLIETQAELNRPWPSDVAEEERRAGELARAEAFRAAREEFNVVVVAIRGAGDPADFLEMDVSLNVVWRAVDEAGRTTKANGLAGGGAEVPDEPLASYGSAPQSRTDRPMTASGHALVYLLATPWGGQALAAVGVDPARGTVDRVWALELPALTSAMVMDLLQMELDDRSGRVIGGFGHAQEGRGFSFISHGWPGATFAEKVAALHAACEAHHQVSMLDEAAREILAYPAIAAIAERPLGETEYLQMDPTLAHAYLQHELRRCLPRLGAVAIGPVAVWLREMGAVSVSLVPCGGLAAFPITAAPIDEAGDPATWRTLEDVLDAAVAPSARALLAVEGPARAGVMTLGDPWPTHQELRWGEAEALTLAALAGTPARASIHEAATRARLLAALREAKVVDACCHGEFDAADFLRSRLLLAEGESLTLGNMVSGAADLRGLRLLILSACQTAILDLRGASDEVRSLAAGMVGAGARAVLGALWSVDDKATYLLMVRFAQEWLPNQDTEPPAAALARVRRWLRMATNRELRRWEALSIPPAAGRQNAGVTERAERADGGVTVRGRGVRYGLGEASERNTASAAFASDDERPYADPIFWSAFQITGW
jgi:tetratricopeptide (TPR) repeat protein